MKVNYTGSGKVFFEKRNMIVTYIAMRNRVEYY